MAGDEIVNAMTLQADQTEEWGTVIRAANGLTAYPEIIEAVRNCVRKRKSEGTLTRR
jgi:hypothetical protein